MRKVLIQLKVYLNITAFLVWFIQSDHRNPMVAATAATGKISVRTTAVTVLHRMLQICCAGVPVVLLLRLKSRRMLRVFGVDPA
jgi:hypothetical protein